MIYYKTNEEIELMKLSGDLVSRTIAEVAKHIQPGVSLIHLDAIAETFIRDNKGVPAFKGYKGFSGTLCTSLNDVVVHGIPNETLLKEGDIISIDCGVILNNYYGDSAFTFPVGQISEQIKQLLQVTRQSLNKAIQAAKAGNRLGDIGFAVQDYCENKYGYGVIREMVGHGIGKKLHEEPNVPNYGKRGTGPKLLPGLVIAIEPMVNLGKRSIAEAEDGWTIFAIDRKPSAHFEHTVAIKADKTEVLTTFKYTDDVIRLDWLADS
jgi:methionyl aminopeptidase